MISLLLPLLAATLSSVHAIPYPKRGIAEVINQCHHDFAYTWDDGPYTAHDDIRAAFDNVGGKTTFFVNGDNWSCIYDQNNVDALRRSFEAGHQIASHTWSHPHIPKLTEAEIDVEIQRLDEAFVKILGIRPKYIRPPFGEIDERTASYIQSKHGKTIVLWSADSGDSIGGSAQDSYDFYANFARAGPAGGPQMTLSHETEPAGTAAMYNGTVPLLANAGIHLVTVAQCLDTDAYEYVGSYGTRDATWTCGGTWTPSNPTSTSTTISSTTSSTSSSDSTSSASSSESTSSTSSSEPTSSTSSSESISSTFTSESTASTTSTDPNSSSEPTSSISSSEPTSSTSSSESTSSTSSTSSTTSSTPTPTCVSTYTSQLNDTCASIEANFGLSAGSILAANTFLNCNDIWQYTPICIPPGGTGPTSTSTSTTSSTSSTPAPTCVSTYSSQPNDTCASIEANFGLPAGSVLAANSFLNCNDIWQYTPICIPSSGTSSTTRPTSTSTSSTPAPTCVSTYSSQPNDTCASIEANFGLPAGSILAANSFLTCNDIWQYTPICIPPGGVGSIVRPTTSTPAPTCASTYTNQPNDTCASIEANFGLPAGSILAANSFLNCNDIWQYTPICIPPGSNREALTPTPQILTPTATIGPITPFRTTVTSSTPVPTCVTTYVSRPNDSCATIESQFHLSSGAISAANSFVNCNDIWSDTPLCIPPGGIGASCTSTISSGPGDTCDLIGSRHGISGYQVQLWNSFLNCNDIWNYTPVCVSHS